MQLEQPLRGKQQPAKGSGCCKQTGHIHQYISLRENYRIFLFSETTALLGRHQKFPSYAMDILEGQIIAWNVGKKGRGRDPHGLVS